MKGSTPLFYALLVGGLSLGLGACSLGKKVSTVGLATQRDSISYAFGLLGSEAFREATAQAPGDSLDRRQVLQGFSDAFLGGATKITAEDAKRLFEDYYMEVREAERKASIAKADSILNANKSKEGVKVTESGLQYRILRASQGPRPTQRDTVVVNYIGRLAGGKVFDNSYDRGEPATFSLGDVIPGWTEGMALMTRGAKYEFLIPPALAYGERGAGGVIPANAPLLFEVELLEIKPYRSMDTVASPQEQTVESPVKTTPAKKKSPERKR